MVDITLKPLFELRIETALGSTHVGRTPLGYERRIVPVTGGSFIGERLSGIVLPGGSDAVTMRPDGGMHLDVRLVLQTEHGDMIYMTYVRRRHGPPEIMQRYRRNEAVAFGEDYFRTVIQFEASSERLVWLNGILAVGAGSRLAEGPVYEIFEIS